MKFRDKFNTYYYRLTASYIVLVLFITAFIGIISVKYYSTNYNNEVINVNHKMLYHLNKIIEKTTIRKAANIYIDMATDTQFRGDLLDLFNQPLAGNHAKIKFTADYLRETVGANSDIIDSMHVFYRKNDVIISSKYGLLYRDADNGRFRISTAWVEEFRTANQGELWMASRDNSDLIAPRNIISLVKPFPYPGNWDSSKGCLAVNIKEEAIRSIIQEQKTVYEDIFIIDAAGDLITHTDKSVTPIDFARDFKLLEYVRNVIADDNAVGNFVRAVDGKKSMVSHTTIRSNGWKIVNITPIDHFYKKSQQIQRIILLICLVTMMIGLVISNVFSSTMYNPLKDLTNKILGYLKKPQNASTDGKKGYAVDEYNLIDEALANLSNRVNMLESTLQENKPLIKHNIVSRLLHHTMRNRTELDERLRLIGVSFTRHHFTAILMEIKSDIIKDAGIVKSQAVKYNLIKAIENASEEDCLFLATEISDYDIGIIINSTVNSPRTQAQIMDRILQPLFTQTELYPHLYIGSSMTDPLSLHVSFSQANTLRKIHYFYPDEKILYGTDLLAREVSQEEIPAYIVERFRKGLKTNKLDLIRESIETMVDEMRHGRYSTDHCHQKLSETVTVFDHFIKETKLDLSHLTETSLYEDFGRLMDIKEFRLWLSRLTGSALRQLAERSTQKNALVVQKARDYIDANLEGFLSLDIVAEKVYITPRYLSRLFKEHMGLNFSDYVNDRKMEAAKTLILETNLTINEISRRFRYSSSAYFIKKFKLTYGMTPAHFKQRYVMGQE